SSETSPKRSVATVASCDAYPCAMLLTIQECTDLSVFLYRQFCLSWFNHDVNRVECAPMPARDTPGATPSARERILSASYDLFARRGVGGVGVDEVIERSSVAKATFYKHFPSTDDLVLAFLDRREEEWIRGLIEEGSQARGETPEERLLAI